MDKRLILEVCWGPLSCHKGIVTPGRAFKVGRVDRADFVVPHDEQMSGLHFEISWDGSRCRLRDLRSANGTWLNGQKVTEGDVEHGSWIRAGDTVISVYVEGAAPLELQSHGGDEPGEGASRRARDRLRAAAAEQRLYGLLDAARSDRVLTLLHESVDEYRSLFEGIRGEVMAEAAPYLVQLAKGSRLLDRIVSEGWGQSWGIYFTSRDNFKDTRTHLRRLLMVDAEGVEGPAYFRYYDPRVLREFLPLCSGKQVAAFFGNISLFFVEGRDGSIVEWSAREGRVSTSEATLRA
jgi:hypothetical protein